MAGFDREFRRVVQFRHEHHAADADPVNGVSGDLPALER
jgi:hypothetical protein